ncbi:hypothetical protein HOLleu_39227 [Holothuria leucospilota]|uniref:Sulfotransferase n=1 Tax=Holothuria leucospilota TaxID=206669 RepID=A0A9Q0YI33_HOLLE|nr:hypothetical protein HOLleu_39227 [Holothuria leucospilota]
MMNDISHQTRNFFVILCGIACIIMIFAFLGTRESYGNTYQRYEVPEPFQIQNWTARKLVTTSKNTNECSILHPKLNSCNTLPNYYLYPKRRDDFHSAIINFWHIQKAGGSSVEKCLNEMQRKLKLPPAERGGTSCHKLEDIYEKFTYFQNISYKPVIQGHKTLGLCDFFHDINPGRICSTFSLFREPYERAVSHYYFAREVARKGNHNKGFQRALNMPVTEWTIKHGSPVWEAFHRIWRTNMTKSDTLKCEMISENMPEQKWPSNDTSVNKIIDNLDKHLSFVGLLEDMFTTYQMMEEIYNLPFVNLCYGKHVNKGSYENLNATANRELRKRAKRSLMENEDVRKLFVFDVLVYEKAKEIFNAQKKVRSGGTL